MKQWKKKKIQGTLFNLQHFWSRRAYWSSKMGLKRTQKQEFKMKSIYTTKEKGQLVQVEYKWCERFNKDNFKHKFYMARNFWDEAPLPSL
jgi:hypothetical protein